MNKKFCSECGSENKIVAKFCFNCGKQLKSEKELQESRPKAKVTTKEALRVESKEEPKTEPEVVLTSYCIRCAKGLEEGAKSCPFCGSKNPSEDEELPSPNFRDALFPEPNHLVGIVVEIFKKSKFVFCQEGIASFDMLMKFGLMKIKDVEELFSQDKKSKLYNELKIEGDNDVERLAEIGKVTKNLYEKHEEYLSGGLGDLDETEGQMKPFMDLAIPITMYFFTRYPALLAEEIANLPEKEQEILMEIGTNLCYVLRTVQLITHEEYRESHYLPPDENKALVFFGKQALYLTFIALMHNNLTWDERINNWNLLLDKIAWRDKIFAMGNQSARMIGYPTNTSIVMAMQKLHNYLEYLWTKNLKELSQPIFNLSRQIDNRLALMLQDWPGMLSPYGLLHRFMAINYQGAKNYGKKLNKYLAGAVLIPTRFVWVASGRDDLLTAGKDTIDLSIKVYDEILMKYFKQTYDVGYNSHQYFVYLFEMITLRNDPNFGDVEKKIDNTIALFENDPQTITNIVATASSGLVSYANTYNKIKARTLADTLISKIPESKPKQVLQNRIKDTSELQKKGFKLGLGLGVRWQSEVNMDLDENEIFSKKKLEVKRSYFQTISRTLMIQTPRLIPHIGSCFSKENVVSFSYPNNTDREREIEFKFYAKSLMLAVKYPDGTADGLLFIKAFMMRGPQWPENTWYIYGVADSDGPLAKSEITISEFIDQWSNRNNFEETKTFALDLQVQLNQTWF